jgi:hypothetical protein
MKTRPDDRGIAKNESERAKYENGTRRPRYPGKTTPGAQNMKSGADAHGTAEK